MDFLIPFLTTDFMGKPAWVWLAFVGIVVALLAFDLGVLQQDDHEIGVRESLLLSAGYISVALIFGAWVWWCLGAPSGMDSDTGFMVEKSLSMDNVFVIALIVTLFAIPLLKFLKKHMRVTEGPRGNAFWVREPDPKTGQLERFATPLFEALVLVSLWKTRSLPAVAEPT